MNTPPENSTIINVCIIPPADVAAQCVRIGQLIKSDATMFVLDGEKQFAHQTVYMARFANDQVENTLAVAQEVFRGVKSFHCEHVGYFRTEGRYLEASYRKSPEFTFLQHLVSANLKECRLNPRFPHEEEYFAPYSNLQKMNSEMTGYDLMYDLSRPHITFG